MGLATGGTDLVDQRLQLVGTAPGHTGHIAFAGEALGDRPASRVTGADHQHHLPVAHAAHLI